MVGTGAIVDLRVDGWIAEVVRTMVTGVRIVHARRGLGVPRAVALTFDDGPSAWTPPVLDALAAREVRATFFVLGASVEGHEEVLRRAVDEGHELGNHAYSHSDLATLGDGEIRDELVRTSALIEDAVGQRPRLFRPPYAAYDRRVARVARDAGLSPTVLRSVDPADWRQSDPDRVAALVLEAVRPGAIVCLHDGLPPVVPAEGTDRAVTVAALPLVIDGLARRGLRALTVSELLA